MDTLTLCRKIADIDGWAGVDTITNVGALSAVVDGKGGVMGKALLLGLILKHKVCIDRGFAGVDEGLVEIWPDDMDTSALIGTYAESFANDDEFPRAVLLVIIQANDL